MLPDEFSSQDIEYHRATAASYDADVTATYSVYHRYLLEPYLDNLAREVGPARALDLGCGTGVVSLALAKRGFDVLGVDHSEAMLAIATQKLASAELAGSYSFVVGDVRELPANDATFDCVTCQGLLHHLQEINACLRELARVLRPGGHFYISEPCRDETPLKRALVALWRLALPARRAGGSGPPTVEAPISPADLSASLQRLGLEFEMRFLTHLPPLRTALPERVYLLVVRAASFPWRSRRGDLVFVFGRKPEITSQVVSIS